MLVEHLPSHREEGQHRTRRRLQGARGCHRPWRVCMEGSGGAAAYANLRTLTLESAFTGNP